LPRENTALGELALDEPKTDTTSRNERRAARKEGELDSTAFLKLADKFIDLANRENTKVKATQLHMAFLYAAARYNAYVAKSVSKVEEHEKFVAHMVGQYQEMLRQHLADDSLEPPSDQGLAD
jgi:ATP-dependent helicase/DNAse subunit B